MSERLNGVEPVDFGKALYEASCVAMLIEPAWHTLIQQERDRYRNAAYRMLKECASDAPRMGKLMAQALVNAAEHAHRADVMEAQKHVAVQCVSDLYTLITSLPANVPNNQYHFILQAAQIISNHPTAKAAA